MSGPSTSSVNKTAKKMEKLSTKTLEPEKTLEQQAIEAEDELKHQMFTPMGNVAEFKRFSKNVQNEMIKRPWIRRMMVTAAYSAEQNQNQTMNRIKKISERKNCPVKMNEIEYCIRQFEEKFALDYEAQLEKLLQDEQHRNNMLSIPEDPDWFKDVSGKLDKDNIIKRMEIQVNMYGTDTTYIEMIIGDQSHPQLFHNEEEAPEGKDHVTKAIQEMRRFLKCCKEKNATIQFIELTMAGSDISRRFLNNFLADPFIGKLRVDVLEVKNIGVTASHSFMAAHFIKCKIFWVKDGNFVGETKEKFIEAVRNCHKDLQAINIVTSDEIPEFIKEWQPTGLDEFGVTFGNYMGNQKYVFLEKPKRVIDNP